MDRLEELARENEQLKAEIKKLSEELNSLRRMLKTFFEWGMTITFGEGHNSKD